MNRIVKKGLVALAATVALLGGATACTSDADRVNENLSTAAENFEIQRTIVFYNGVTDTYIAVVEGRCSTENDGQKLRAICKVGPNEFSRDEVGLSDNVTYFVLQTKTAQVDDYSKRIVLKPGNALPNFDVNTGED